MKSTSRCILSGVIASALLSSCVCRTHQTMGDESRAMMSQTYGDIAADGATMANIYFAFDKSELSESSKAILGRNAEWLRVNQSVDVRIEGHADERGTSDYNMALAKNRALAGANYLRSLGINGQRISTISYGEERPIDSRQSENAWAKNRRVEFNASGSESGS